MKELPKYPNGIPREMPKLQRSHRVKRTIQSYWKNKNIELETKFHLSHGERAKK